MVTDPKTLLDIMRRTVVMFLFALQTCFFSCLAQNKEDDILSINLPMLWNKVEVTNVYGPPQQIKGSSLATGLDINFEKRVYNRVFVKTGLGYFKDKFSIQRPFDYDYPYSPLFTT